MLRELDEKDMESHPISSSPQALASSPSSASFNIDTQSHLMDIPRLTQLVLNCDDVDLIPDLHIERVYPFSLVRKPVLIPKISYLPQRGKKLPAVNEVEIRIRKAVISRKRALFSKF
jgi:hypothetical protein